MSKPILIFLSFGILACSDRTNKPANEKPLTEAQQKETINKLKLDFNQPVLIDSSAYVMYPLTLERNDENARRSFESKSYVEPTTYWNILFYNTKTEEYHLLDDNLKMLIYSYSPGNIERGSSSWTSSDFYIGKNGYSQVDNLLYFSITTTDFNKDQKLNSEDPNYLFISDKTGKHFKQISPNNLYVKSWRTIKATNKILMMVTKDSNGNKKFDDEDESFPLIYDLTKNTTSTKIFPDDYKLKLKKKLYEQWAN
ncbi:MAG: hypothetical protein LBE36_01490 [Flavobacteriaceae bacterium]|jgi:hypothetical protein|nr:hypothetical protein [Flavobacteriaceae bacterium]